MTSFPENSVDPLRKVKSFCIAPNVTYILHLKYIYAAQEQSQSVLFHIL